MTVSRPGGRSQIVYKLGVDKWGGIWYNIFEREVAGMLQKNIDKQKRKERKTWVGLYTRTTPTKRGKLEKISKKYRKPLDKCD